MKCKLKKEYYSSLKWKGILIQTVLWMNFEDIMLGVIS